MSQQKPRDETDISHLSTITDVLDVSPETKANATDIYTRVLQEHGDLTNGRGKELVAASSLILASYKSDEIIETTDITEVVSDYISEKSLHKTARNIRSKLNEGLLLDDPRKYVKEISDSLNAPEEHTTAVNKVIDELEGTGVTSGKKAAAIAASAYYLTTLYEQASFTQKDIAEAAGVSEVTIRKNYKRFRDTINTEDT